MQPTTPQPTGASAGSASPAAFKQAVTWAAANPDAPQAKELQSRIVAGKYNDAIAGLGLKPEQFGYRAPAVPAGTPDATGDTPEARAAREATQIHVGPAMEQVGAAAGDLGAKIDTDLYKRAQSIVAGIGRAAGNLQEGTVAGGAKAVVNAGVNAAGQVAGGALDLIKEPMNALVKAIGDTIASGKPVQDLASSAPVSSFLDAFSSLVGKGEAFYNDFAAKHPEVATTLESVGNIAALLAGGKADAAGGAAAPGLATTIKDAAAPVIDAAKSGTEAIANAGTRAVDAAISVADKPAGVVDAAASAMKDRAVNKLEADYSKWTGQTKTGVKAMGKAGAKTAALDAAGTTGATPQRILAEAAIIPETEGTKFSTFDQAKQLRDSLKPLNDANTAALKEVDLSAPPAPIDRLEASTVNEIRSIKKPASEIESMVADAQKEYSFLRQKYGDAIKPSEMNVEKQAYSNGVKFDGNKPLQGDVNYQIRRTFQKSIEDAATQAGHEDVAQLNREIGDRLGAADFLQSLDGQTLKFGKIGKYAFMGIGASLGHGVVGKVFGALGGEMIANVLMKADVAGPVKRLLLSSIEKQSPEAYQATLEWMKQQGLERDIRLALPSGPVPTESIVDGQRKISTGPAIEVQAPGHSSFPVEKAPIAVPAEKISIKNPKTGKFDRAYTSNAAKGARRP